MPFSFLAYDVLMFVKCNSFILIVKLFLGLNVICYTIYSKAYAFFSFVTYTLDCRMKER